MGRRPKLNLTRIKIYFPYITGDMYSILTSYFNGICGVSVAHESEEHVHEAHGHKTTHSSQHGGEKERETKVENRGIFSIRSRGQMFS